MTLKDMLPVLFLSIVWSVSLVRGQEVTKAATNFDFPLGPDDQIEVRVSEVDEFEGKPIHIDAGGYVQLPLAGRVHAEGMRTTELQEEIARRLTKYVQEPQVTVRLVERRSRPVSILGAVKNPGVQQLQGPKRLVEVLSLAGGPRDDAGRLVRIARRRVWGSTGLPNEVSDTTGQWLMAEADLDSLLQARDPASNVLIRPEDVVTIPVAQVVYVLGEVHKAGGFTLKSRERMSALQALSLAEGLQRTAAPKNAKILRAAGSDGSRTEIPVNISRILDGRDKDVDLRPDDILVIPNNLPRNVALRTAETAVQLGTGVLIYRR